MPKGIIVIIENLPYILGGVWVTLTVVAGALSMGLIVGLVLSVAQVYGNRTVRRLV
ncbi:MAG: amino acid ABC transporter permease, partial [Deltaproteobacteria bacterium]|nr:amino acid ABC transporter permease [Deltaproteobacteria bacterium]